MKKILPTLLIFLFFSSGIRASHLMGGEITWLCQANGQYVFTLILYRDCAGIPIPTGPQYLEVYGNPGLTMISLSNWYTTDITYCQPVYNCNNAPPGATEQGVYYSNPVTLSGVPPAGGWTFAWHSCCRNNAVSNISSIGFSMRATMYAFNGQNANPCFDSSPAFAEKPKGVLCASNPFVYNHGAFDNDMDSLHYEWGMPLDEPVTTPPALWTPGTNPPYSTYNPPYSYNNPLPFSLPNLGATIDPFTGEINFTSFISGNFVTNIKVSSYKCGVLVSEIFREIQFVILACDSNNNPAFTAPFQDSTGAYTLYADTVMAGDSVYFNIGAFDFDLDSTGNPQNITLSAYGSQFGANFSDTASGCLIPPCAIIDTTMPVTSPMFVSANFKWHTTTDHLGMTYPCAYIPGTYYFNFKATDSHCPAPALDYKTVAITVLPIYPKPFVQNNNSILSCLSNGFNYQWYRNRFMINGATQQSFTPVQTGIYQVRITDSVGSGNYSDPVIVNTVNNLNDPSFNPYDLLIHPNPASQILHISFSDFSGKEIEIVMYDLTGREIFSERFNNNPTAFSTSLSLNNIETGIYTIGIRRQSESVWRKVMILKD